MRLGATGLSGKKYSSSTFTPSHRRVCTMTLPELQEEKRGSPKKFQHNYTQPADQNSSVFPPKALALSFFKSLCSSAFNAFCTRSKAFDMASSQSVSVLKKGNLPGSEKSTHLHQGWVWSSQWKCGFFWDKCGCPCHSVRPVLYIASAAVLGLN